MQTFKLIYATNRNAVGLPESPSGYGKNLTTVNGGQDLRFGAVEVLIPKDALDLTSGQGLSAAIAKCVDKATITPYPEKMALDKPESVQTDLKLGSKAMFWEVHGHMLASTDVVVYIHGFNMSWSDAVADAIALEIMLNRSAKKEDGKKVMVVLFTWPSDGMAIPMLSYLSDRADARTSGLAMGRAMLKLRDFLITLRNEVAANQDIKLCEQEIHLLCHSMGNYLLQKAVEQLDHYTPGNVLPRIFDHIFLCAPDVDDTVLEAGQPLSKLSEMAQRITVYHNESDKALRLSDTTKGNPDRLGTHGAARPTAVHNKVHQVNCQPIATGLSQHSYFLDTPTVDDIRQSVDGVAVDDVALRQRVRTGLLNNVWTMKKS